MSIARYISRLKADPKACMMALTWVLFMCFFTYTDLLISLLSVNHDFAVEFRTWHMSRVSVCVNFGLVIMLLFDYSYKHQHIHRDMFWIVIAGLFLCLFIFLHCGAVNAKSHINYIFPLNWADLSIFIFVGLLGIVFILKSSIEFSTPVDAEDQIHP